jgi:ketosteroid isomerase-like protein
MKTPFRQKRLLSDSALLTLGLALALHTPSLSAQDAASPKGSPERIKSDLVQIEREIGRANFECDYKYFARIEGDEFVFTSPAGDVTTKAQDLAGEKDCHKFEGSYDLDETVVSVYANAAVVTSRVTISGKNKEGKPFTHRSRFTDVFVWRDGRWQIVAGHSSRIPGPGK